MRILHLTDLHLTSGPRLADQAAVLEHVVAEAVRLQVQATVITGDLYGMAVPHRSTPAERAVLFPTVRTLAKLGPVVIVYGNHDYPGDLETLTQLGGGFDWPVRVASTACRLQLRTSGPDLDVYCLPWVTKRWLLAGEELRGVEATRQLAGTKVGQLLGLWAATRRRRAGQAVSVFAAHCMIAGARTSGGEQLNGTDIETPRAALVALAPDVGLLGHIHTRQEAAPRCWYGGDPYAVDHGEVDTKGYTIIDIAPTSAQWPELWPEAPGGALQVTEYEPGTDGEAATRLTYLPTPARRWLTLDWRWAADHGDEYAPDPTRPRNQRPEFCAAPPRWITRPTADEIASVDGCEVRARLVVPAQWRSGCPWDDELAALRAAGAHRIQVEAVTEPVLRVRAPEVAQAATPLDKARAYWATLATPPDEPDQAAAEGLLADLLTRDDEDIQTDTDTLIEL